MDVAIVGLQNAGKTSLLRVLAVSPLSKSMLVVILELTHRSSKGGRVYHRVSPS
jgi:ABC-type phosphate/phosphonate transport system ATPase subunit